MKTFRIIYGLNSAEVSGTTGADDDNNGYVDDVHGINLIDPNANTYG